MSSILFSRTLQPQACPRGKCDSSRQLEQSKATQAKPYLTTDDNGKECYRFKVAFLCVSLISVAVLEYVKVPQLQGPVRSPKPSIWVPTRDLLESPVNLEICRKLSRIFHGSPEVDILAAKPVTEDPWLPTSNARVSRTQGRSLSAPRCALVGGSRQRSSREQSPCSRRRALFRRGSGCEFAADLEVFWSFASRPELTLGSYARNVKCALGSLSKSLRGTLGPAAWVVSRMASNSTQAPRLHA